MIQVNCPLYFGNLFRKADEFRQREKLPEKESELAHDIWHTVFDNDASDPGEARQSYAESLIRQRAKSGSNGSAEVSVNNFALDPKRNAHLKHVSLEELKNRHADYIKTIDTFEAQNGKIRIEDLEDPTRIGKMDFKKNNF